MNKISKMILGTALVASFVIGSIAMPTTAQAADEYENESNNLMTSATTLNANVPMHGVISEKNDIDCYSFTMPGRGYVVFRLSYDLPGNYDYNVQLDVLNQYGNVLTTCEYDNEPIFTYKMTPKKGTKYYLRITSDYGASVGDNYTLLADYSPTNRYEIEQNNSIKEATKAGNNISKKKVMYGVALDKDMDYFRYTLKKSGQIKAMLSLDVPTTNPDYGLRLDIYNKNGKSIGGLTVADNATLKTKKLKKGTYYIRVSTSDFNSEGEYSLTIK